MAKRVRPFIGVFVVVLVVGVVAPAAYAANPPEPPSLSVTPLGDASRIEGTKAPTSRLAQTDPGLLARDDRAQVPVLVKLDYDAVATYSGGVAGLAPTSPSATGRALTQESAQRSSYAAYVAGQEADFVAQLDQAVPQANVNQSLRLVYGGVAATIPANSVETVLAIPGVVAVQADTPRPMLTDSSNEFIGSPTIWNALGGQATAGSGTLFASLDSGAWPEHPSFAANPALPRRRPTPTVIR